MDNNKELNEILKTLNEKFDKLIETMSDTFFTKDDYTNPLQNLGNADSIYAPTEENNAVSFSQKEVEKMAYHTLFSLSRGFRRHKTPCFNLF